MTATILITIFLFVFKVVRRWEKKDKAKVVKMELDEFEEKLGS